MKIFEKLLRKLSMKAKFAVFITGYSLLALAVFEYSSNLKFFGESPFAMFMSHILFISPLAAASAFFLARHFLLPIRLIGKATKEVAKGEFKTNVLKKREDEFGELIDSLNSMIEDLHRYQTQQFETRKKIKELAHIPKENPNPVLRLDRNRKIVFVNRSARSILDYYNLEFGMELPKDTFDELVKDLDESGKKEFDHKVDEKFYRFFVVNNEEMETFNVYGWDITDQLKAKESIIEARDKALELSQIKSKFLATMSHEIRTPMNGIIGLSNILIDMDLTEEQEELTRSVITSANSLLTIINDILDFSKIEAGKMTIEYTPMNIEECMKDSIGLFTVSKKDKEIDISYELHPDTPKMIESDPSRLRQIIINLVGNAVKFTSEGSVKLICSSEKIGDTGKFRFWFEVRDTGMGIPYDLQHRLFQDFSQVDGSITRKFGGTGLGLAICRKLSELLGGSIWAESKPGDGSSFFFSIIAKPAIEADSLISTDGQIEELNADFGAKFPLSIAIAEDNKVNQMVIKKFLKKIGYQDFIVYENGFEVSEGIRDEYCDVVLMDMQMPVMSGIEASQEIMESDDIPIKPFIIAMTANAMEEDKQACFDAGMKAFVSKPIHLDKLAISLKQAFLEKSESKAA